MKPIAVAHKIDANPTQRSTGELLGVSELQAEAPATDSTTDTVAAVDTARTASTRGKPRLSKTRCAIVGCDSHCDIKGTRDLLGDLIYRTPASPEYARANAERMFCSRADAKKAGYREEPQG